MVKTVKNVRQEIVVHVSSPLRRRGIVGSVQTKPVSTSYRCFDTLLIGRNYHRLWCRKKLRSVSVKTNKSQKTVTLFSGDFNFNHCPFLYVSTFRYIMCNFSALTALVDGRQDAHQACKNLVMTCWCGYLSGARCRLFAYNNNNNCWEYVVLRCWHLLPIWLQLRPHSCSSNPYSPTAFGCKAISRWRLRRGTGLANSPKPSQQT